MATSLGFILSSYEIGVVPAAAAELAQEDAKGSILINFQDR